MNKLVVVLAAIASGCAHRPLHVAEGTQWTLPLIDPLARRELTVPVLIDGKGPYPFLIAPNSPSVIDAGVARQLGLYTNNGWYTVLNQSYHDRKVQIFEVPSMVSGTLQVRNLKVISAPAGSLSAGGRQVVGLLGDDVLTSSLVMEIDRDRGVVQLAIAGHEQRPPSGAMVPGERYTGALYVRADVDGKDRLLLVDLTAAHSATRDVDRGTPMIFVDETGSSTLQRVRTTPSQLRVDGVSAPVHLAEFVDQRVRTLDFDGVLGQDFLSRSRVTLDPHRRRLWLAARDPDLGPTTAVRIARWGDELAGCAARGCATLAVDGDTLTVTPALARPYQVTVEALDAQGQRVHLFPIELAGVPATLRLGGPLADTATVRVVDAAPVIVATR